MEYKLGDIIAISFGVYEHFALVSKAGYHLQQPMLISATKRTGTVKEEPWDIVTEGKKTRLVKGCPNEAKASYLIDRARSLINNWEYSVKHKNCEHFMSFVVDGELSSKQVRNGFVGGGLGVAAVGVLCKQPKAEVYVLVGLAAALTGVYLARHQ